MGYDKKSKGSKSVKAESSVEKEDKVSKAEDEELHQLLEEELDDPDEVIVADHAMPGKSIADYVDILGNREMLEVSGKDPAYHYYWANIKKRGRVRELKRDHGYEVVTKSMNDATADKQNSKEDAVIVNGESLLMRCPKDEYIKREAARKVLRQQRLKASRDRTKIKDGQTEFDVIRNESERVKVNG